MQEIEYIYRLGGCQQKFIESLGSIGPVYLQARNRGGGLGRHLKQFQPLLIPEMTYAVDPDSGLAFSLDEYVSSHFINQEFPELSERIDVEFGCFPAGLSLVSMPELPGAGAIADFVRDQQCVPISDDELVQWREELGYEFGMCECCQEAAAKRGRNPEAHALHTLFSELIKNGDSIRIQLFSEHVDFISKLFPKRLDVKPGYLVLTDTSEYSILHLNMELVHAVQIGVKRIDDELSSVASIYDSHGNMNFQFTTPGREAAARWDSIFSESAQDY